MKQKFGGIFYCIFQTIIGILLLIDPIGFTSGILVALGVFLAIIGIVGIIRYFKTPVIEASKEKLLTKGLLSVLAGIFCMFGTDRLLVTFPIITILYGIIMLVIGVSKIQSVMDSVRRKEKWGWTLISAAITLICATIVILNPFSSTVVLWTFTGISLIVDSFFDLLALILLKSYIKEANNDKTVDSEVIK